MASVSGSVFSQTLQDITATKLDELSKRRAAFEAEKATLLTALQAEKDGIQRLVLLAAGVRSCYAAKENKPRPLETELHNLDLFLAQARYDPSISAALLQKWEASLLEHLDNLSLRYSYAALYAQLVTEWLSLDKADDAAAAAAAAAASAGDEGMAEPFEDVGSAQRLKAREQWERDVFEEAQVDEVALQHYLEELFLHDAPEKKEKDRALRHLQAMTAQFEQFLALPDQFNHATLDWTIAGLLASDLLTDQKREVLKDFQGNPTILSEVADVLNMRMAALDTWSWGPSVPVEEHRKINGVFDVKMHEDLLQAIFIQYIGVKWSVFFKRAFNRHRSSGGPWITHKVPIAEKKRLRHYFGPITTNGSVQKLRRATFRKDYFVAQLLDHERQTVDRLDGEEEAQREPEAMRGPETSLLMAGSLSAGGSKRIRLDNIPRAHKKRTNIGANNRMMRKIARESDSLSDSLSDSDLSINPPDYAGAKKNPMQRKQRLLHILAAEAALGTRAHGDFTALHASFARWNDVLPHATIRSVLAFFGVSKKWLGFFVRFLEAPLQFLGDGAGVAPRTRRRGTPAAHVLSDVFGEVTLFCLDFAVNRATGGSLLYRLLDDAWFWTRSHDAAVTAWTALQAFARATGTAIDEAGTGCVRIAGDEEATLPVSAALPAGPVSWGFLQLSARTGRFEIQQARVTAHIGELRRQLQDKRPSVFAFIQTWNTYADTFFTSNFGAPANCFGRAHVDAMLAAHARIQRDVFQGPPSAGPGGGDDNTAHATSVADYLKATLRQRYGVTDLPDAYLFFPVELGGLGLRSPFVPILQLRAEVAADPADLLERYFERERSEYERARRAFAERLGPPEGPAPARAASPSDFPALAEYANAREAFCLFGSSYDSLPDVYRDLLRRPSGMQPAVDTTDGPALDGLARQLGGEEALRKVLGVPLRPYWAWILALYGPEALRRVGGLALVDRGLLPMGMVSLFREKRVQWQE